MAIKVGNENDTTISGLGTNIDNINIEPIGPPISIKPETVPISATVGSDNSVPVIKTYGQIAVTDAMALASAKDPNDMVNNPKLVLQVGLEHFYRMSADINIADKKQKAKFAFAAYLFGPELVKLARAATGSDDFSANIDKMVDIISTGVQYSSHGMPQTRAIKARAFFNKLNDDIK